MNKDEILKYYAGGIEKDRLKLDLFKWEGERTKEIISRFLPDKKLVILDIGGGTGYYSFWLRESGHDVSLVDLSPENIKWAKGYSEQNGIPLTLCEVGEASALSFPDNQFDVVLLLGPLYHLVEKEERIRALSEAKRVLKPGGLLLAAVISRYASLIDGLSRDLITDDRFERILLQDLQTGKHINETDNVEYFTTAYFHTPSEIKDEISESGLELEKLIGIESVGWIADRFVEKLEDDRYRQKMQKIISLLESNEDLIAMSPHIMAVARKNMKFP